MAAALMSYKREDDIDPLTELKSTIDPYDPPSYTDILKGTDNRMILQNRICNLNRSLSSALISLEAPTIPLLEDSQRRYLES